MTTMQLAILAGALLGAGLAAAMLAFAPTRPALGDFLSHLNNTARHEKAAPVEVADYTDRIGVWLMRHLPVARWLKTPSKDLDLLQVPLHRFYADKAIYAGIGLIFPLLFAIITAVLRIPIPLVFPMAASIGAAAALSLLPDLNIRRRAAEARIEFEHALTAYLDLVAIARNSGAQTRQAMELAANTGESWAFARIREALLDSRFSGRSAWDALRDLAEDLEVTGLADTADIMRLSAEDNAAVYPILRAKASAMRNSMMNTELAEANTATTQMTYPEALLPIIFIILLGAPALIQIISPG